MRTSWSVLWPRQIHPTHCPSSPLSTSLCLLCYLLHAFSVCLVVYPPLCRCCLMSSAPLTRACAVGGNAVSAFLSWRLQATNACDVTLVWKNGFESVAQYGISFRYIHTAVTDRKNTLTDFFANRSERFGNERFKPRQGPSTLLVAVRASH